MSAFIERITGGQVGGTTERSIRLSLSERNAPDYPKIREMAMTLRRGGLKAP